MKHFFVILFFMVSAFPVFANTSDDLQNAEVESMMNDSESADISLDDPVIEEDVVTEVDDEAAVEGEEKFIQRCQVHARNRFGFTMARFFSFKPNFGRCFNGFRMCRNWLSRNNRFGFCREARFNRFPRDNTPAVE